MQTCKYFNECGGCNFLNLDYSKQLEMKKQQVIDTFQSKRFEHFHVEDCEGVYFPYKYRNKVHFAIEQDGKYTNIGFYGLGSNKVVEVSECMLFDKWAMEVKKVLTEYIKIFKLTGYDKLENRGLLRYLVARFVDNQLMVVLVATTQNFAGKDWFYNKLKEKFANVSFYLNINNRTDNNVFEDDKFILKFGAEKISSKFLDLKYKISPSSFYQVNEKVMQKMYNKAFELMNLKPNDSVIDLFSGIGITSMMFAKVCKHVYSIECSKSSVCDARENIRINNLSDKISYYLGDCGQRLLDVPKLENCVMFLDPARVGCCVETIKSILKILPRIIIYMSCNPKSLADDVALLSKKYRIVFMKPYDMFPQTDHVETLVCLELK